MYLYTTSLVCLTTHNSYCWFFLQIASNIYFFLLLLCYDLPHMHIYFAWIGVIRIDLFVALNKLHFYILQQLYQFKSECRVFFIDFSILFLFSTNKTQVRHNLWIFKQKKKRAHIWEKRNKKRCFSLSESNIAAIFTLNYYFHCLLCVEVSLFYSFSSFYSFCWTGV